MKNINKCALASRGRERLIALALLAVWSALSGCAQVHSKDSPQVIDAYDLDSELAESSGLWCSVLGIFTLNDSGNAPRLYQIDPQGRIIGRFAVDSYNHDWESLTGDEESLFIGDFGNNKGARKGGRVIRMPVLGLTQNRPLPIRELMFDYADRPQYKLRAYDHDFDAEAMVARSDDLLVFSKSWKSNVTRVYRLDKLMRQQLVDPIATLATPGWVVTGATLEPSTGAVILVGYQKAGLPLFMPVIARVSPDLQWIDSMRLEGGQVEAVCSLEGGDILYTQERSVTSGAKLYRIHSPFNASTSAKSTSVKEK
jgi:hypothetical protein